MASKIIYVKATPNASANSVEEMPDGVLKIRIKAVPEKGEANKELIAVLSKHLNISKNNIRIVSGHKSRLKKIEIFQ